MPPAVDTPAPGFTLPSTRGGPVALSGLLADGPAVVMFVTDDCPTCELTLRRLAAVHADLTVVCEAPPAAASRLAARTGFGGRMLSEPAPYETSRAYGLEAVPTTVAIAPGGAVTETVVGWDAAALAALLRLDLGSAPPARKPGCAAKSTYDPAQLAADAGAGDDDPEAMFELGWTDGLPTIAPTPERVAAMLAGRDPGESLGPVPPGMGQATLARIAACAVLAGCRPEHFPVVEAGVRAMLVPGFNLHGQAVTTQPAGQIAVVNGPVRRSAGLNPAMGALGPGTRANATIGRALRLVVALTGEGMPGRLDRSTLGQPGKVGTCLAEDEERSPWPPLHVERGLAAEQSAVTLVAGDAPLSISEHRSRSPEELAAALGWAAASLWAPNWWPIGAATLFVICPEHADTLAAGGWSKDDVRRAMWEEVQRPAGELRHGEFTARVGSAPDAELVPKWDAPDDILLVVAGGEAGRFSAVFGPCVGMDWTPVTQEVRCDT
jgi:AhpC/TSA family protein